MIYENIIESKNGFQIPVFKNGKPMHSKYNPQNEAEVFAKDAVSDFFIILGIGGAYHITKIAENNPKSVIIAIENSDEDLNFIKNIPEVIKNKENKNIIFTTIQNIKSTIIKFYKPSLYNTLSIKKQRSWTLENSQSSKIAEEEIKNALNEISQDFSVQSHFGKLWHRNILTNITNYSNQISSQYKLIQNIDTTKKAAIIAAGPSLDKSIEEIQKCRNEYYIFCTDTAYGTLIQNKIIPDFCITVDAQNISHTHYHSLLNPEKTVFTFDISSSGESIKKIYKSKGKLFFIKNNHPLSVCIDQTNVMPSITAGAGTVTIASCDLASYLGFNKIKLFGADFSYGNGKPYTKGTYLDTQFALNQNRVLPNEMQFSKLMYRTELLESSNKELINPKTSETMLRYKETLEQWAKSNGFYNEPSEAILKRNNPVKNNTYPISQNQEMDFSKNKTLWINNLSNALDFINQNTNLSSEELLKQNPVLITILPLIATLKNHKETKTLDFLTIVKLALSQSKRYTNS